MSNNGRIIIGIDPGTTTVGFAVIQADAYNRTILDYGVVETTPKIPLRDKLKEIGSDFKELFNHYKPEIIAVEELFFTNNQKTGIAVAHARGVIIYEALNSGAQLLEYTPLQIKKGMTGNGKAIKQEVQNSVKLLYKLDDIPKPDDAADALAIAYIASLKNNSL